MSRSNSLQILHDMLLKHYRYRLVGEICIWYYSILYKITGRIETKLFGMAKRYVRKFGYMVVDEDYKND